MKGNIRVRHFIAVMNGLGGHWEVVRATPGRAQTSAERGSTTPVSRSQPPKSSSNR